MDEETECPSPSPSMGPGDDDFETERRQLWEAGQQADERCEIELYLESGDIDRETLERWLRIIQKRLGKP